MSHTHTCILEERDPILSTNPTARDAVRYSDPQGKNSPAFDWLRLKSRWKIDECPCHLEMFREMRGERFYAEGFRGVMAGEQQIDTEFFSRDGSPMRRFAGN